MGYYREYLEKLEGVISEIKYLDKKRIYGIDYKNVKKDLLLIKGIYEERLFQTEVMHHANGIGSKSSRTKGKYRNDSFILSLYINIWCPYKLEVKKFIKEDFYRYATEVLIYLGMQKNICFEHPSSDSKPGQYQISFYWENGIKKYKYQHRKAKPKFKCHYFNFNQKKCALVKSQESFKCLCMKRDSLHHVNYNSMKLNLDRILKNVRKNFDYYNLEIRDRQLLRYLLEYH
jgi:hypothetical protein